MKIFLFALASIIFNSCYVSQDLDYGPSDLPPPSEPGTCYARCMVPDRSVMRQEHVNVYTGIEEQTV